MSRHEGVSCDSCLKGNFRGRRYKCLICYDYDLCALCYEAGATTTRHTTEHPMQCILTRSDFDLYYGGESLTVEQPQSFTCPYCGKMGFTETTLQEHVTSEHSETSFEVVCPVCASLPGGDPNHVTEDFAGHLTLEHRSGPRDLDEPVASRHGVRRIPHPSRGVGGPRPRRANMHFSSAGGLSSLSPSSRENVDPIAELLSQLSGVRRSTVAAAAAAGSTQGAGPSLQQLQMQLQLERQQAARQPLERLPRRQAQAAAAAAASGIAASAASSAGAVEASAATGVLSPGSGGNGGQPQSQFLLSRGMDPVPTEAERRAAERERADRGLFVRELIIGTLGVSVEEAVHLASLSLNGKQVRADLPLTNPSSQALPTKPPSKKDGGANGGTSSGRSSSGNVQCAQQKVAPAVSASKRASGPGAGRTAGVVVAGGMARPPGSIAPSASGSGLPTTHHHDMRSNAGPGLRGIMPSQPLQRVLTGTGTIREVVSPPQQPARGGSGSGAAGPGAGSPGTARRKPVRPIEGRNQSTEPPPPH
ncbi:E3 ubiquitin-protein ligase KCMF1-like [Hetaerina americana]|uniref:E3 ubiquitin-protein ligase KCMF1-like n=1 Tax=Hetaerina americana TaxID=62018 RepID=UPI003A7F3E6A